MFILKESSPNQTGTAIIRLICQIKTIRINKRLLQLLLLVDMARLNPLIHRPKCSKLLACQVAEASLILLKEDKDKILKV